ncbi:MAG: hypothetical protein ABII90_04645 [Bacteroidota bacterium]
MKKRETILEIFEKTYKKSAKASIDGSISINDLREKEEEGLHLTEEQWLALRNYEKYRINELNNAKDEENFHKKYEFLQVLANLRPYQDFLEEE